MTAFVISQPRTSVYFDFSDDARAEAIRRNEKLAAILGPVPGADVSCRLKVTNVGMTLERVVGYIVDEKVEGNNTSYKIGRRETSIFTVNHEDMGMLIRIAYQYGRGIQQPVNFAV